MVLDGLVDLTTRLASLATARRSAIVAGVVITATENLSKALAQLGGTRFTQSQFVGQFTAAISAAWDDVAWRTTTHGGTTKVTTTGDGAKI